MGFYIYYENLRKRGYFLLCTVLYKCNECTQENCTLLLAMK